MEQIRDRDFTKRPRAEQLAFLISLADLGGQVAEKHFIEVLSEKNIARRQSIIDKKLLVIDAISRSINRGYLEMIEKLDRSGWSSHKTVRHAIQEFLRRER